MQNNSNHQIIKGNHKFIKMSNSPYAANKYSNYKWNRINEIK